jgi:Protein of unknown function (DUF1552)
MMRSVRLSRRAVLRGAGAAIALPWLEAMVPAVSRADEAAHVAVIPRRIAFLYVPNGVHMADWTPAEAGAGFRLPTTLRSLEPFRRDLLVLSGLAQQNASPMGDEGGDHARSLACFLTGAHPLKTDGANIRAGVSIDQVAAGQVGQRTRLPSLELGIDPSAQAGSCDSGYSCAYSSNISWKSANLPMAKEVDPRLAFDRLFGWRPRDASPADRERRERQERSILDFVLEDARQLNSQLGVQDRRKIEEYLNSVREIERRIAVAESLGAAARPIPDAARRPVGIPADLREHIRLMLDLLALAFQADVTRISTFMFANEASNRAYPFLNVPDGHHDLSHHGNDPGKHEKIKAINRFHVEQLAYLLGRLKSMKEGDGTLLDHVMVVYGSGISDGDRHNHDDLPILLAGRGGGSITPGRHIQYDSLPLNNLYLSMLDRMGVKIDRHGDSTGRLGMLDGARAENL